jgi:hypothetical protein
MKLRKSLILCGFIALLSSGVHAFDLPKVDIPGTGSSSGQADVKGLADQQSAVVKSLNTSLRDLSKSQAIIASALGLQEEASVAKSNADSLSKGDLSGKDDIKKAVTSTLEVQKKIDEKMAQGTTLDAASKAKFATAIPPYATGAIGIFQTANKAKDAAKSLSQTRDLTVLSQLGTLVYVSSEAPNLISSFSSATSNITKFASANGVDTSKLKNVTKSLGE